MIIVQPLSQNHIGALSPLDIPNEPEFQLFTINRNIIQERFTGDWRQGQEIKQVVITKRFYQVSSNSSEA